MVIQLPDGPMELPDPEPRWKLYESAIAHIEESAGNATVIRNHKVLGRQTGKERQVDVWLEVVVGNEHRVCVAIECKCYDDRPVSIKDIEAFISFLEDVGAHKGVMISHSGFSEGALKRAEPANVELKTLTLEEAEEFDWDEYVADSCETDGCFGTIAWQFSDRSSEAGYCSRCGTFHVRCGGCGNLSWYDESRFIKCDGCDMRWRLAFDEGMASDITELPPEEEEREDTE
ncbi:MAG: restriction endonuclease [Candidatus Korobacteraceae bacterium]